MPLLLKITDGIMKGAEVALLPGTRIKLGADENGDIVIPDATLPAVACELDVTDDGCTLLLPEGATRALPLFTIQEINGLSFAIGPADGEWDELKTAADVKQVESPATPAEPADVPPGESAADTPADSSQGNLAVSDGFPAAPESSPIFRRFAWLALLLVVLLCAIGWLFFRRYDATRRRREAAAAEAASRQPTLESLVHDYRLEYSTIDGMPHLKGNLQRRTERLAVRALALAAAPKVTLDLTDDQSIREASEALLFTLTEGKVTLSSAANRSIAIAGEVADVAALTRILKAFEADLPSVEHISAKEIVLLDQLGNVPAGNEGAANEQAAPPTSPDKAPEMDETTKEALATLATTGQEIGVQPPRQPDYPVAGILTVPYPCVVLRNGTRCTIGAQLGEAVIEKIEADCITLQENGRQITWRP